MHPHQPLVCTQSRTGTTRHLVNASGNRAPAFSLPPRLLSQSILLNHAVFAAQSLTVTPLICTAQLTEGPPDLVTVRPPRVQEIEPEQISENVREVFQDREGNLWFGTNGDGVARFDGESLTYLSVEEGLAGSAIRGMLQAPDRVRPCP